MQNISDLWVMLAILKYILGAWYSLGQNGKREAMI